MSLKNLLSKIAVAFVWFCGVLCFVTFGMACLAFYLQNYIHAAWFMAFAIMLKRDGDWKVYKLSIVTEKKEPVSGKTMHIDKLDSDEVEWKEEK